MHGSFRPQALVLGEVSKENINFKPVTVGDPQLQHLVAHAQVAATDHCDVGQHSFRRHRTVTCITGGLLLYLLWQQRFYWLTAVAAAVFGGMLLNMLLKYAFHRARPHFDDPILTLTSYSFPSGHTMMATVLYGVLAAYLLAEANDWRRRVLIILAASFLILLVGFSRIYLGAHYLSDVLGAMAEGLAWLSLCLTVVYSVWLKGFASGIREPHSVWHSSGSHATARRLLTFRSYLFQSVA